ncbi:MAG: iron-sulfur cluster repair di-iron protein [Calditrichaeota bacterium]|nr:MAG: iron-sulfur cluster repair di-iron protein [Calditrichota bacterium]
MDTKLHDAANKTVAQLVTEDYRKAEVFKKFGIDFCCGGKRTVHDVCEEKGLDLKLVLQELEKSGSASQSQQENADRWELGFLADYIVNVHHKYVSENIPLLLEFSGKVARVHGENYAEVVKIAGLFEEVAAELQQHLLKEERILFPYIKHLENIQKTGEPFSAPPFESAKNPIAMMEAEHERAGSALAQIDQLSNNYTPPEDACNTFRISYSKLKEFEEDLHRHVHLENNILFPKAIALEVQLQS